jgi:acyl transferase domain-containing protein/NADP-dependent 3-hydroxy acid dehydrogenase YdfG
MESINTKPVPVAIIGISCLFPRAADHRDYWANILNGVDCITEVPPERWNPDDYFDADPNAPDCTYARRGGFLDPVEFPPLEFGITPNTLEATDSSQLLGLLVARAALEDAGYGADRDFDRGRASVILGVTGTQQLVIPLGARLGQPIWRRALREAGIDSKVAEQVVQRIADSYVGWQEESFPGLLGNVVAGRIANRLNLHGTNCIADAACASSLSALHLALLELSAGRCDLALSGGMDTFNDIFMYLCFSKTPALSPSGDARPFAANADGTILGEGLGCVVLKRLADAERDGDRIYAVIRSIGTSSDGKGNAIYAPSPEGQLLAIRRAYALAGVSPDMIDLVEAHGTGTRAGDAAELAALTEIYRPAKAVGSWCALGSVKSQIGHTKAAAGAAGLIKAALALHHKVLPPTIKVEQPAPPLANEMSPFYVNTQRRPWLPSGGQPRRAAVSSFGFGGSNFHCVLEEHQPHKKEIDWDGNVQIVAFSAMTPAGLREQVTSWRGDGDWQDARAAARESRIQFRPSHGFRLVVTVKREQSWPRLRSQILARLDAASEPESWALPEGACFNGGASPGKLALLFPGQGSQYPGMLLDLVCQFPQMLASLRTANEQFSQQRLLSDLIYPPADFAAGAAQRQAERLKDTAVAQPALAAVSFGAWRILQEFGVQPDAVAGHSFGELTALCVASRLGPEQFMRVARLRGQLMANVTGNRSGMLAVGLSAGEAETLLRTERLRLVIANRNAPQQTVLSGELPELDRASVLLRQRNVAVKRLAVGAAFHSPLVADVENALLAALPPLAPSSIPVFANTTGLPYLQHPEHARCQLARQLAEPVLFQDMIANLYAAGCRTFVEVGPGSTLTGLVRAILHDRPHQVAALDASAGKNAGQLDLARTLMLLAAAGYAIKLDRWDDGPRRSSGAVNKSSSFTVRLSGANYRSPPRADGSVLPAGPRMRLSPTLISGSSASTMNDHKNSNLSIPVHSDQRPAALPMSLLQQNLSALQQISEQTSQLHRQFLEGQDRALQIFQTLLQQQQALAGADHHGTTMSTPPALSAQTTMNGRGASPGAKPAATTLNGPVTPITGEVSPVPVTTPLAAPSTASAVTAIVQAVVAEKTGYPADILTPEMELDADLGIDSIKRVEIFSALQERLPEAPAVGTEHMPALRTLADVIAFLDTRSLEAQKKNVRAVELTTVQQCGAIDPVYPDSAVESKQDSASHVSNTGLQRYAPCVRSISDALQRRRRPLQQGAIVWILSEPSELANRLTERLQLLGFVPHLLNSNFIPPKTAEAPAAVMIVSPKLCTDDAFLERAFRVVQQAGASLRQHANQGGAALVTVSRLDGGFGFLPGSTVVDPLSGGLAGLTKTAAHEWPSVRCKAIDLAPSLDIEEAALALTAELETDGPIEIGITDNGVMQLALERLNSVPTPRNRLCPGDVFLITGGGRGITGAVAVALAKLCPITLILVGRSPTPISDPNWLAGLNDPREIKRRIHERSEPALTPRELEQQFRDIQARREIQQTLACIAATGAEASYHQVDVRDAARVRALVDGIRRQHGPIKGLIHGAGIIADHRIEDKTVEQFRAVYDTKVAGLRNLLAALAAHPVETLVLFSSSSARFGRAGQADYAVANEVLNKLAQAEARRRADCHVIAFNWGPWAGGMVDESLQRRFDDEGIATIPIDVGARFAAEIIMAADVGPVEQVVLAGGLPDTTPSGGADQRPELSLDEAPTQPRAAVPARQHMHHEALALAFTREVGLQTCPVLRSHVLGGRAVVPLVLHLEWLAHGAMHANPGLHFMGFDDLRILGGVKLENGQTCKLTIMTGKPQRLADDIRVMAEIHRDTDRGPTMCSRASIVLGPRLPEPPVRIENCDVSRWKEMNSIPVAEVYQSRLFHGPELQGIRQIDAVCADGISGLVATAPPPAQWLARPLRSSWLTEPLAVDASFQLMVLWCWENQGMPLLPTALGNYRQFCRSFPGEGVRVIARVTAQSAQRVIADIDYLALDGRLLARLQGGECVLDASLKERFRQNQLLVPASTP